MNPKELAEHNEAVANAKELVQRELVKDVADEILNTLEHYRHSPSTSKSLKRQIVFPVKRIIELVKNN